MKGKVVRLIAEVHPRRIRQSQSAVYSGVQKLNGSVFFVSPGNLSGSGVNA